MNKVYDVFLSHAAPDTLLAREVANTCRANGLEAFSAAELQAGADRSDAVWDALAECRALILLLSPSGLTSSMWVEIGAVQAWKKPIFAVVTDPSIGHLPPALSGVPLYSPGRVEEIVEMIERGGQQLSDEERLLLARLFVEIGVPIDDLALDPRSLTDLAKRFSAESGRTVSEERLLSELLRMHKQGTLTRSRVRGRPRRHSETA